MTFELKRLHTLGLVVISVAASLVPLSASAESIQLVQPSQAATVQNSGVYMTVYYLDQVEHLDVVATFAEQGGDQLSGRLQMGLADGAEIDFVVPGRTDVSFQLIRSGNVIDVHANPAGYGTLAAKN